MTRTWLDSHIFYIFLTVKYKDQHITIRCPKAHHQLYIDLFKVRFNTCGHCTIEDKKLFTLWKNLKTKNLGSKPDGNIITKILGRSFDLGYIMRYDIH